MINPAPNPNQGDWASTLLLIPTRLELDHFLRAVRDFCQLHQEVAGAIELQPRLCGFGPIASGIETSRWLANDGINNQQQDGVFQRVLLLGIAGTYEPERFPVGTACSFRSCGIYGIGAGMGEDQHGKAGRDFQTIRELGFPQTQIDGKDCFDELPLRPLDNQWLDRANPSVADQLLTVCVAAGGQGDIAARRREFPTAIAEDMEAFAVAMAAARHGIPTTVIRGMSNVAGDRDVANWKIADAMQAAVAMLFMTIAAHE